MRRRNLLKIAGVTLSAETLNLRAFAQTRKPLRIGAIVDMGGVYSGIGGPGGVAAVKMAVHDFGPTVNGRQIEVLQADYQNKVEVTSAVVRRWYDQDDVSMVIESTDSASALALQNLTKEKERVVIFAGSASSALTNKDCSPYGIHYVYDTYMLAHGTGAAVTQQGDNTWFFITADYAFGHSLQHDTTAVINQYGGKVIGSVNAPLGTNDFSSFILQAQASKAKAIGLAIAGRDVQNCIRQAAEFGLGKGGQKLVPLLIFLGDIKGLGLQVAQGLRFVTGFYWNRTAETRAFSERFYKIRGTMPTMVQAGMYSATMHYLNAVKASNSESALAVIEKMKATPIDDFYTHNGRIRADGRMVYDIYLVQVKTPSESKSAWDLYKIVSTIPAKQVWRPLSESQCPLVHH